MAHELTFTNGLAEMAYVGDTPWHGFGQKLRENASIEEWQVAAGMDWLVRRAKVQYIADRAGTDLRAWDDKVVLLRSDSGAPLGIVSPDYHIVQPYEVLEFFRDMVDTQGFKLETAGTLFGGSRFWALAKVTEACLEGWDKIGAYVLLSTTADGSRATEARDTTVRVVCNNTLSSALSSASKKKLTISHRTAFDAPAVQKALGLSLEKFQGFVEAANLLTSIKISAAGAEDFVTELLRNTASKAVVQGDDEDPDQIAADAKQRTPRGLTTILELFAGAGEGAERKGSKGTLWGVVNAVTEYVDHHATAKSVDHRVERALWGTGDDLKTRALEMALAVA